jgi:glycosyltransferase involved in cell wall biosynthesis
MNASSLARVSVVIPTFRRHDSLALAVRSALLQGNEIREVLIVDDNRRPEDEGKVKAVLASIGDSRLVYLRNLGEPGGSASRNVAIRHASAPMLAFLDDDDQWLPGKIDAQLAAMTPDIAGIDCGYVECDETWGLMLEIRGEARLRSQADLLAGYCPTSTSLVMLRRDVALQAGLFDEGLASFEDYDFWIRCAAFGAFATLMGPHCIYVQHAGYRLSVATDARLRGLDEFLARWGDRIGTASQVASVRRHWRQVAMATNARRTLPSDRIESLGFALSALRIDPSRQHGWQPLLFVLAGFPLARRMSRLRNASRNLPERQRALLRSYQAALAAGDSSQAAMAWPL